MSTHRSVNASVDPNLSDSCTGCLFREMGIGQGTDAVYVIAGVFHVLVDAAGLEGSLGRVLSSWNAKGVGTEGRTVLDMTTQ